MVDGHAFFQGLTRAAQWLAAALVLSYLGNGFANAQSPSAPSKYLAPGFTALSTGEKILLMPIDAELFSISAGGVIEPKADWTAAALNHMKAAIGEKKAALGLSSVELPPGSDDEFEEQIGLFAAVAISIALHHGVGGMWALPSKNGVLDWSFGDAMKPLQESTGARYGLFIRIRDTYASVERKVATVALALLGVGLPRGMQSGYASLVELETGRVVWFNRLQRTSGDLREPDPARESIDALLANFPPVR